MMTMQQSPWRLLLFPRYWLFAPFLIFLRLIVYLPYKFLMTLGRLLGQVLLIIDRKGRHTAQVNLRLCFPEYSSEKHQQLLKKSYESIGQSIIETALAWFASNKKLQKLLHVHGAENLRAAQQGGKGVMLVSAHLACLEIAGRIYSQQQELAVVYRDQKLSLLDAFAKYYRYKCYHRIIVREDLRTMLRALNGGEVVWYTPDVDAGRRNSVFAPFFGISTASITATSRLAKHTGIKLVPTFFYRRKDNAGYDFYLEPALENYPSDDPVQDATLVNQVIEKAIRQAPEQYLWQYKRFKTRPEGEKRFY